MHWVELSRRLGRLKLLRYASEPVVGQQFGAALECLVDRLGRQGAFVVCDVEPEHVDVHVVEAPAFDDDEDLGHWLADQARAFVSTEGKADEYVVQSRVLHRDPDRGARCLIVVARRDGIESRLTMIEAAGLRCERLATGLVEPLSALVFEPGFTEGQRPVVLMGDAHRVHYLLNDGELEDLYVDHAYADGGRRDDARRSVWPASPFPHDARAGVGWVFGSRAEEEGRHAEGFEGTAPLREALDTELPPAASVAAALALEAVYPELALTDLLGEERGEAVRAAKEKEEGQRAVLLLGGILVFSLLLALLSAAGMGTLVEREAAKVAAQEPVLERLRAAEAAHARLRSDLETAERLTGQSTQTARLLEDVGRAVPEGVWMVGLSIRDDEGRTRLRITGIALDGEGTAEYLTALERLEVLGGVELRYAEHLSAEEVERRYRFDWAATGFEIEAVVP